MSTPRVLVVDDNALNLELARHVLEAGGFIVDLAADVPEAWQRLTACRPDVALVDIQLPGTDGLSLVHDIRARPALAGLPVIAFTAFAMPGDKERFRAAGCDGYIAKPIDVRSFAAQVREVLAAALPGLAATGGGSGT